MEPIEINVTPLAPVFWATVGALSMIVFQIILGFIHGGRNRAPKPKIDDFSEVYRASSAPDKLEPRVVAAGRILPKPNATSISSEEWSVMLGLTMKCPVTLGWVLDHYWTRIQALLAAGMPAQRVLEQVDQDIEAALARANGGFIVIGGNDKSRMN